MLIYHNIINIVLIRNRRPRRNRRQRTLRVLFFSRIRRIKTKTESHGAEVWKIKKKKRRIIIIIVKHDDTVPSHVRGLRTNKTAQRTKNRARGNDGVRSGTAHSRRLTGWPARPVGARGPSFFLSFSLARPPRSVFLSFRLRRSAAAAAATIQAPTSPKPCGNNRATVCERACMFKNAAGRRQ